MTSNTKVRIVIPGSGRKVKSKTGVALRPARKPHLWRVKIDGVRDIHTIHERFLVKEELWGGSNGQTES